MHDNTLFIGSTGCGKSTTTVHWLADWLEQAGRTVCVLDQQRRSTAWTVWKGFLQSKRKCVFDNLDDEERHFPLNLLTPSRNRERETEEFMETLIRRRGSANVDANPLIELWSELWCKLLPPHWTLKKGLQIFRNGDVFKEALDLCDDADVRSAWLDLPSSGGARERITGAAERLISIVGSESIACRTYRGTNEFIDMIDKGYSFCSEGGRVIADKAVRFISASRMKQINRYKMQGGAAKVCVVVEESEAGDMIGPQEAKALQTLRKTGIAYVFVCQEPYWTDDSVTQIVMQNTNHIWMRCDSQKVAELAAKDLMVMFNPYAEKDRYEKPFQIGDDKYIDTRINYYSVAEQFQLIVKWIMGLPIGAGFARVGNKVRYVQFPKIDIDYCDRLAEERRVKQPWLRTTNLREKGTSSSGSSTTDIHTQFNKPSEQESTRRTKSPLEDLFD